MGFIKLNLFSLKYLNLEEKMIDTNDVHDIKKKKKRNSIFDRSIAKKKKRLYGFFGFLGFKKIK